MKDAQATPAAMMVAIDTALATPVSGLAAAMADLAREAAPRAACLCVERDDIGVQLFSAGRWPLCHRDTLARRSELTVVELTGSHGLDRIAVLVGDPNDSTPAAGLNIALMTASMAVLGRIDEIAERLEADHAA